MSDARWPGRFLRCKAAIGRFFPVLCVLGGLVIGSVRAGAMGSDPDRDPVVRLVERLGGQPRRDESASGRPIVEMRLSSSRVTDDQLGELRGVPSLRSLERRLLKPLKTLSLVALDLDDPGLASVPSLPLLEKLDPSAPASVEDRPKAPGPHKEAGALAKPDDATLDRIRAAVTKALPPLQKSMLVYAERRDCFSCHHQAVPLVALEIARDRGLVIDEDAFQGTVDLTLTDLESALAAYRKGRGQPGGVERGAYALWTLEAGGQPANEVTAAVAGYLLAAQRDRDHWSTTSRRPPMEASPFTATALALRALRYYATKSQAGTVQDRIRHAQAWLVASRPVDTEDRVFRLWGLKYADAAPAEIGAAVKDLLAAQRGDGGWAQTDKLASDAYATGSALVALHQAGGLATDDLAYRRGLSFLLREQKADGTWFVASRSHPFQPYFESGFPYGKDQFIAVAASGWAAAAMALALPTQP